MGLIRPYIIADTTYNHEGSVEYLKRVVDELTEIGVNAVKFHLLFNIDDYMHRSHPGYEKIKKMLIDRGDWAAIIKYASQKGLDVVALCDDEASLDFAMANDDVDEIEIHSSGIVDDALLRKVSGYRKKIMLGIGGATFYEIQRALSFFDKPVTLMYGFNGWPTQVVDDQISRLVHTANRFSDYTIGYANHTVWDEPFNVALSCAAAFNGFPILEKHYTLFPGVNRVDYRESVGKEQMAEIKRLMELACFMYGDVNINRLSRNERAFAMKIRKIDGLRR